MSIHRLYREQFIATDTDTLWDFITSPLNLAIITPPDMGFIITSPDADGKVYAGKMITYKVSPLMGIKMNWVTEITQVQHKSFFVDEQRRGPYALWHHEHHLEPVDGGVLMKDIVHYIIPGGPLGDILNRLFIRKKLNGIFEYRFHKMKELFPGS
ncbi:MAG: SRPBCC family protein [Bacteroidetes bacterium]|nr:SRPBCC family protein [Bacteroidota bacterium]